MIKSTVAKLKIVPWRDLWDLAFFLTLIGLFFLCLFSMGRAKTEMDCIRLGVITILMWLMLGGTARAWMHKAENELWELRYRHLREQLTEIEKHLIHLKYRQP